jgi:hypothetical protein|nr:MAG TPA: Tape measure domain protein [Caudoviricetes sp.]
MAEDIDGALGIRATIDASDVQKGANEFIRAIQNMANESDKAVNTMADGYGFLMEQISKLSDAIDAAKSKLTSISGAMSNIAPADGVSSQAYDDLKSQVSALVSENDNLKTKLEETTARISEQAKATTSASTAIGEYQSAAQSAGNSGGIASVGSKAKSEMKELAETIKFDTEQISLMEQEYAKLEQTLSRLQSKKSTIEATPTSSDPLSQEVKQSKLSNVNGDISQTQEQMSKLKALTSEYKGEISQCSQRMSELSNQTAQTAGRTQALRTQLRNARQHVAELILSGKQGTVEFGKAVNEANKLQAAFNKASMAISGKSLAFNSFNMLSTAVNGVTGALTTYMGVAGLFTDNQEELTRIQKNLQAVMSVSMGVQQLMNAATQISVKWETLKASAMAAVAASTETATIAEGGKAAADVANTGTAAAATAANWTLAAAFKAVGLAIKSIPVIGWIIAGVTALVAGAVALYKWATKLTPAEKANQEAAKAYGEQIKKNRETMLDQSKTIGENVGKFKQLQQKYNEVKGDSSKLNAFLKENKDNFEELGFSVNDATDAENIFHKNSNAVIEGFRLRAKAAAQAKVAMDSYAEAYRLQLEAEGWERSAKYGSSRHNKDDQEEALAKAKAMRAQAGKLYNAGDRATSDSNKTSRALDAHNRKYNIKSPSQEKNNRGRKSGGGGKSSGGGKSLEETAYENAQKWHELQLDEEKAFNDKMKEYSDMVLETKEDGAEKELQQIQRTRDEQLKALDEWLDELANKRKQVAMETWVNKKEGRTEQQWSKTNEGKQDESYWRNQVLTKNPRINEVYELNANAIQDKSVHDSDKVVSDILAKYEDKSKREKTERLKTLTSEIKILEDKLTAIENEAEKERISNLLENVKSEKDWVAQSKDAWNEYYQKYGTFLEKRAALEEKFLHDTQGMDENTPEYLMLKKGFEDSLKSLNFENIKKQLNWEDIFGDLERIGSKTLEVLQSQLEAMLKNDKNLSVESIKTISEALNKIRSEQAKKGFVIGNFVSQIKETRQRKKDYENAQKQAENVGGGYFLKRYNEADAEGKAQIREEKVYDPVTHKLTKFGDVIDRAIKAQENYANSQKTLQDNIKAVGSSFNALTSMGKDVSNMLEKFGVSMPDGLTQVFDGFGEIGSAFEGFDLTKIGSFLDVGNYVHAVTGVFSGVADVFSGFFSLFGVGKGNMEEYKKALEQYEKLDEVWTSLISKKKEYLSLSYGEEAKKVGQEYVELAKADLEATKAIANKYLGAWKKGSHSEGYKFNKKMKKGVEGVTWSDISNVAGTNISDISQLTSLSSKQLESIKTNYTKWWVKLPEDYINYLDSIIKKQSTLEDAQEEVLEKLTGVKFDDMYSNFMSCLTDMSKGADDWVSDFKDKIRKALIDNMMGKKVKEWLEDYTKRYQAAMEKGTLTDAERQQFIDEANEKSNEFFNERKEILENIGLGKSSDSSNSGGGFATASEESVEELSGRALAANEALYSIRDIQSSHTLQYEAINDGIQQMITIETGRNEYYNESIEIQRTSVGHLATIAKNTNELYVMNERLAKIEKNTRNM